jgi:glycosyltransferase involved in cell wall biosynthesis
VHKIAAYPSGPLPEMRILFLVPHPLLPPDRGNKHHTFNLLRYIAHHHDCHVIGFHEPGRPERQPWTDLEALSPRLKVLEVFEQLSGLPLQVERARCLAGLGPVALARYRNPAVKRCLESLDLSQYDAVLFDMFTMVEWRALCSSRPCVLIASDAYSLAGFRAARDARSFGTRVRFLVEAFLMLLVERREYPKFDVVSTVSESAAEWLRRVVPGGVYRFVPLSVNEALLRENAAADPGNAPPTLLCWEGVVHEAVATQVAAFLRRVWPQVREAVPGAEMVIWGHQPLPFLKRLIEKTPGVRNVGFVEDWIGTLKQAAVFVFPHRATAGMHLKLMSAFAVGLPVVSTPEAYGWFPLEEGVNAFTAKDWNTFRDICIDLLSDPRKRARVGTRARELMRNSFSNHRVGTQMIAVFNEAILRHSTH